MGQVVIDISMSLDGFVAGPGVGSVQPMGVGGKRLHHWLMGDGEEQPTDLDREVETEMFAGVGAVIMGRTTFDVGIDQWGEDGGFGKPCFVVTHQRQEPLTKGATEFSFVLGGIKAALDQAKAAAGEADICIIGGGEIARQYLDAGLVDELRLHLVSVLLRAGAPFLDSLDAMWRMETLSARQTPFATHMRLRIPKAGE